MTRPSLSSLLSFRASPLASFLAPGAVVVCLSLSALLSLAVGGCREEPTIVIKFEPSDMSGVKKADLAARPADLASAPDLAPAATAGKPATAECKTAADCVVEPNDCCTCTSGGAQHAVAKKKLAALEAARKKGCGHTMCPMIVSHDPSCAEAAGCVAGACQLVAKKTK
jgi:hypothetical protein